MENAPIVWFDNIRGEVNAGSLASILTARKWADRILGKTKRFSGRVLTTWCIAGNGLRFSREMGRRTVIIELDAMMPRAWLRTNFKHELPGWALENRATLVRACIILVQNWIAQGRKPGARTLGSYESWARVMGGILEAAGIEGFLEKQDEQPEEIDREAQLWNPFIENWWAVFKDGPVTAKVLLALAEDVVPDDSKSERSRLTYLGNALSKRVKRTFEVESCEDGYLKIIRAEVPRAASGPTPGYALSKIPRASAGVHDAEKTTVSTPPPTENPENPEMRSGRSGEASDSKNISNEINALEGKSISPDVYKKDVYPETEVWQTQVPENKGESRHRQTCQTSNRENRGFGADGVVHTQIMQPDTPDEGAVADLDDDEETPK